MRKQFAILLLMIHLSVNTEAGQLFRLPYLLHHYHLHLKHQAGLSLGKFLMMHYTGDDGKDEDHGQLPFHDFFHSSVTLVYAPMIQFTNSGTINFIPARLDWQETREELFFTFSDLILQPPRRNC